MDSEMIGIIASDMRQIYMSEMLKKKGYEVYLLDLREAYQPRTLGEGEQALESGCADSANSAEKGRRYGSLV